MGVTQKEMGKKLKYTFIFFIIDCFITLFLRCYGIGWRGWRMGRGFIYITVALVHRYMQARPRETSLQFLLFWSGSSLSFCLSLSLSLSLSLYTSAVIYKLNSHGLFPTLTSFPCR